MGPSLGDLEHALILGVVLGGGLEAVLAGRQGAHQFAAAKSVGAGLRAGLQCDHRVGDEVALAIHHANAGWGQVSIRTAIGIVYAIKVLCLIGAEVNLVCDGVSISVAAYGLGAAVVGRRPNQASDDAEVGGSDSAGDACSSAYAKNQRQLLEVVAQTSSELGRACPGGILAQ